MERNEQNIPNTSRSKSNPFEGAARFTAVMTLGIGSLYMGYTANRVVDGDFGKDLAHKHLLEKSGRDLDFNKDSAILFQGVSYWLIGLGSIALSKKFKV